VSRRGETEQHTTREGVAAQKATRQAQNS
jgi:hypothetical protein